MNRQALEKLRDFLLATPVPFKMSFWHQVLFSTENPEDWDPITLVKEDMEPKRHQQRLQDFNHTCGTAACAAGWSVYITPPTAECFDYEGDLIMGDYVDKILGLWPGSHIEQYMFSGSWSRHDDTRQGAAYRIDQVLKGLTGSQAHPVVLGLYTGFPDAHELKNYIKGRDTWLAERGVTL